MDKEKKNVTKIIYMSEEKADRLKRLYASRMLNSNKKISYSALLSEGIDLLWEKYGSKA